MGSEVVQSLVSLPGENIRNLYTVLALLTTWCKYGSREPLTLINSELSGAFFWYGTSTSGHYYVKRVPSYCSSEP
jgi:hypothetical protein